MACPLSEGTRFAGEVIKLGAGVSGFSPGDRVVVSWINPCLECEYCKRGLFQFCVNTKDTLIQPAGFSEQVRVPAEHQKTRVYKFSDALDFELAALTEPMACALNGIENAGVKVGDTVVVMGAGFMGLLLVQLAQLSGAVRVVVVDGIPYRLELARELGATETINFRQTDVVSRVSELTGGLGADVVIEATGNIDAYRQAVELGRKGSTVLYFGGLAAGVKLDIDTNVIHYRQVTLKGSYSYTPETFRKALSIIESGRLKVGKLITHRYPLSELKEAYQKASEPDSLKVMISFD